MMGGFVAAIRSLTNPQGESHQAMSMRRWMTSYRTSQRKPPVVSCDCLCTGGKYETQRERNRKVEQGGGQNMSDLECHNMTGLQ